MTKVKVKEARAYYLRMTAEQGLSRNVLLKQINGQAYERHILAEKQHNFAATLPEHLAGQADEAMKDVYLLDFLGIGKPVGVAEYTLTHDLPRELAGKLPDAKQIEAEILRELGAEVEG
ncbi:MAG: hypothetical protein CXR30_15615 [Geobacter sp.]|nr:MAG: hypothetical protein CXR30_15615 [Geobacter sp.]